MEWSNSEEPPAEGPEPNRAARREHLEAAMEADKDRYGCPYSRIHPADIADAYCQNDEDRQALLR
eukprot:14745851-Alexandrium_andersonii.AAC.1